MKKNKAKPNSNSQSLTQKIDGLVDKISVRSQFIYLEFITIATFILSSYFFANGILNIIADSGIYYVNIIQTIVGIALAIVSLIAIQGSYAIYLHDELNLSYDDVNSILLIIGILYIVCLIISLICYDLKVISDASITSLIEIETILFFILIILQVITIPHHASHSKETKNADGIIENISEWSKFLYFQFILIASFTLSAFYCAFGIINILNSIGVMYVNYIQIIVGIALAIMNLIGSQVYFGKFSTKNGNESNNQQIVLIVGIVYLVILPITILLSTMNFGLSDLNTVIDLETIIFYIVIMLQILSVPHENMEESEPKEKADGIKIRKDASLQFKWLTIVLGCGLLGASLILFYFLYSWNITTAYIALFALDWEMITLTVCFFLGIGLLCYGFITLILNHYLGNAKEIDTTKSVRKGKSITTPISLEDNAIPLHTVKFNPRRNHTNEFEFNAKK